MNRKELIFLFIFPICLVAVMFFSGYIIFDLLEGDSFTVTYISVLPVVFNHFFRQR